MASSYKKSKLRSTKKRRGSGRRRKRRERNHGTTPKFPIHSE